MEYISSWEILTDISNYLNLSLNCNSFELCKTIVGFPCVFTISTSGNTSSLKELAFTNASLTAHLEAKYYACC